MVCEKRKIDSNVTGLAVAEEVCPGQLPTLAVDGYDPIWYVKEPNSYSDLGGEITTVARSPIDRSRQNKKGTVTDNDASGGYNTDVTKNNITRDLQGFFYADAREPLSTAPLNGDAVVFESVTVADGYLADEGLGEFAAGQIVLASGFANAANNGIKLVTGSEEGAVEVAGALAEELDPPAAAKLIRIGGQLTLGDVSIAVNAGIVSLVSVDTDFTEFPNLFPGKWLFIGGDTIETRFTNNVGFARISAVNENSLVFDDVTWTPVAEAGAGKSIRFFAGITVMNEKEPELIKLRSYSIERTLGVGPKAEFPSDQQAEYLEGAFANELTLNMPQADKLNVDLTYVALDNTYRTGANGDKLKPGVRIPAPGQDAINTSSDIYRIKMNIVDPNSSNAEALFGYVTEASITINNGVTPVKALGHMGGIDVNLSNFEVAGSVTAYLAGVEAVRAVRNNADVAFNVIIASKNAGQIWDIPLLGLGGGRVNVEKDAPVTVPLETAAAENKHGYTMSYTQFEYLPSIAMAA